jgi:hypothetical protein
MGGSTNTNYITNSAGEQRIFIHMLDYIGGIKWAYYQNEDVAGNPTEIPNAIADCALANFGLQLAFVTENPIHLLIFETLTGKILYQYRLATYANSLIKNGIEARNKEETGIFLGYYFDDGTDQYWNIIEIDQSDGSVDWSIAYDGALAHAGWDCYPYDLMYTGKLGSDEYERLYALGMHTNNAGTDSLLLMSIDTDREDDDGNDQIPTAPSLIYEWEYDDIDNGDANDFPAHLYVKYLNVFVCGQSETAETATGGMPWLQYSVVIKSQEQFEPQIRW